MRSVRGLFLSLLLLILPGTLPAAAGAEAFLVIVNAANPVASLPAAEISKYFLHKSLQFPSGTRVAPVDLTEDSSVRDAFSRVIHEKGTSAIKAYWQKMIFSGRDIPPPEKSPAEALSFVRANVGGIGYVAGGTQLGDGVKSLRVTR
jgi:hypothetical protein